MNSTGTLRWVVLDRDGVVNHDSPDYIKSAAEWQPIAGSLEAIARLSQAGWRVCLASNQAGLGRKLFDYDAFAAMNAKMQKMLAESRDTRMPRMRKMIELLAADGISITMEDVMAAAPDGATVGRPHLADALVANGVVATRDEAFIDLLHNDSKYYVTHAAPTPESAIDCIKRAGGVSVIAHPFASRRGETISADSFSSLVKAGLNGIEVNHRDHSADLAGLP